MKLMRKVLVLVALSLILMGAQRVEASMRCSIPGLPENCYCLWWGTGDPVYGFYVWCTYEDCPLGYGFCETVLSLCPSNHLDWCDFGTTCEASCEPLECC